MDKEIKIHVLECGIVGTDETISDKSRSKNPYAYTGVLRGKKHRVWIPVFAYLIEHPKGNILIDSGWHTDVRKNQKKHMSWKLNIASKALLPEGKAIDEQLLKLGIEIEKLNYVFVTHFDVDHISGLKLVKEAKNICASAEEIKAVNEGGIRYNSELWSGINIKPIIMNDSNIGPFNRSYDLFGDGTIILIDLSGHSKGTMGVMVKNNSKFVIITSDSCYNKASWEELKLPGIVEDKEKAIKSLKWIQNISEDKNCIKILATHDKDVEPHVITLK